MKGYFLKAWLWIKSLVLGAVVLYIVLFIFNNNNKEAKVWWWFGREPAVSLLSLIFTVLAMGVLVTLLVRTIVTTVRQIQETRTRTRTMRLEREVAEMRAKAEMLQKRDTPAASTAGGLSAQSTGPAGGVASTTSTANDDL
jgi:hypothetical protein